MNNERIYADNRECHPSNLSIVDDIAINLEQASRKITLQTIKTKTSREFRMLYML